MIISGFQWLDGSFMEDKETLKGKAPNDIDVVTFFELPNGTSQEDLLKNSPQLFINEDVKKTYHVDSFAHLLGKPLEQSAVHQISYWYSMWSHRRDGLWKGFIQVDLSTADDDAALSLLEQIEREGAQP